MNVYDFDKTIFYPDSSVSFFLYCLKHYPAAVLPRSKDIVRTALLYARRAVNTKELKQVLFSFLRGLPEPEEAVRRFWDKRFHGIGAWYLARRREDDLIISASPEFLVREPASRLGVALLGTRMDIRSGVIEGENCHDEEKVRRFYAAYPDGKIEDFYSDSLSDAPLARIAQRAWIVKKEKLSPWPTDGAGRRKDRD